MITQRKSLTQALAELEAGTLAGVRTVVVSRKWWNGLSMAERNAFRLRADRVGIELRADSAMSSHYVEARGGDAGPPLSTERPA